MTTAKAKAKATNQESKKALGLVKELAPGLREALNKIGERRFVPNANNKDLGCHFVSYAELVADAYAAGLYVSMDYDDGSFKIDETAKLRFDLNVNEPLQISAGDYGPLAASVRSIHAVLGFLSDVIRKNPSFLTAEDLEVVFYGDEVEFTNFTLPEHFISTKSYVRIRPRQKRPQKNNFVVYESMGNSYKIGLCVDVIGGSFKVIPQEVLFLNQVTQIFSLDDCQSLKDFVKSLSTCYEPIKKFALSETKLKDIISVWRIQSLE